MSVHFPFLVVQVDPANLPSWCVEDASPFMNADEDYKWRRKRTLEAWNRRANE